MASNRNGMAEIGAKLRGGGVPGGRKAASSVAKDWRATVAASPLRSPIKSAKWALGVSLA